MLILVYGFIPKEGPIPDVKVGVADSAYTRATAVLKDLLYLPEKLPVNGENPRVSIFSFFFVRKCLLL